MENDSESNQNDSKKRRILLEIREHATMFANLTQQFADTLRDSNDAEKKYRDSMLAMSRMRVDLNELRAEKAKWNLSTQHHSASSNRTKCDHDSLSRVPELLQFGANGSTVSADILGNVTDYLASFRAQTSILSMPAQWGSANADAIVLGVQEFDERTSPSSKLFMRGQIIELTRCYILSTVDANILQYQHEYHHCVRLFMVDVPKFKWHALPQKIVTALYCFQVNAADPTWTALRVLRGGEVVMDDIAADEFRVRLGPRLLRCSTSDKDDGNAAYCVVQRGGIFYMALVALSTITNDHKIRVVSNDKFTSALFTANLL